MQADINQIAMRAMVAKRDQLQSDMKLLARLVGEERFADRRLTVAMSKRIGLTSSEIMKTEKELAAAHQREIKLDRAKIILNERIRKYELEREEQLMTEFIEAGVALKLIGQCAARKRH